MNSDKFAAQVRESLPTPGATPLEHLRHTVAAYSKHDSADSADIVIPATLGVYGDDVTTGLTMNDLRAVLATLDGFAGALAEYNAAVTAYDAVTAKHGAFAPIGELDDVEKALTEAAHKLAADVRIACETTN